MAVRHKRATLGADRAYDAGNFVKALRALEITPHAAQNTSNRRSAIDGRTTRHEGYTLSQQKRKRVEEVFGWLKTVALQRKTRFRGPDRVGWMFTFAAAAYNLVAVGGEDRLGVAETSELFRQVPAITILLKPATFFHSSSTDLAPGGIGRRVASTRR